MGGDARFEVLEEPPWPGGVRFRLRCEYGSFGRLDGDLARAANRELACRLSGHWGLLCVTAADAPVVMYHRSSRAPGGTTGTIVLSEAQNTC